MKTCRCRRCNSYVVNGRGEMNSSALLRMPMSWCLRPACVYPFLSPPKAEEDNPDPGKLTPVAVIGWEDLKLRLVNQQKEIKKMSDFVAVGGAACGSDV